MIGQEVPIAIGTFLCLLAAALGTLFLYARLPTRYHRDETSEVVRLIASLFAMMTSLVLGLMINSAKNTFEAVDHNVHVIATEMILLDRSLRQYGPEMDDTRAHLFAYAQRALVTDQVQTDPSARSDRTAEALLYQIGNSLAAIKPPDPDRLALWQDAREHFHKVVGLRWDLVEQSEGTIPTPLITLLVLWLMLIFGSFGYRAPRNAVVIGSFVLAAALVAGAIYLILDMDVPFQGLIRVARTPVERVIAEMK